jgi:SPX domain protein involved in polyphosphate accumulation
MAKKITRSRPWTKEEVRMLKMLAREKVKTNVIARKLKPSVTAVYLRASKLAVMLGGGRGKKRV